MSFNSGSRKYGEITATPELYMSSLVWLLVFRLRFCETVHGWEDDALTRQSIYALYSRTYTASLGKIPDPPVPASNSQSPQTSNQTSLPQVEGLYWCVNKAWSHIPTTMLDLLGEKKCSSNDYELCSRLVEGYNRIRGQLARILSWKTCQKYILSRSDSPRHKCFRYRSH